MSNKITQGNWKVTFIPNSKKSPFEITTDDTGTIIAIIKANIYDERLERKESEANAKLIAAAPDLLNALQQIKHNFEINKKYNQSLTETEITSGLNMINLAINKATL